MAAKRYTRRAFLQAATAGAGLVALPVTRVLGDALRATGAAAFSPAASALYFFDSAQAATAAAIAARILPTGTNPVTGAVVSPGAAEASAVRFIDMFLAAFHLPGAVADNPAVYLRGPYSGRWPFGDDETGLASGRFPPDAFEGGGGPVHFLGLSANQALAWYLRLYGTLDGGPDQPPLPAWVSAATGTSTWRSQVASGLIPGAQNLRQAYVDGLKAFDDWAEQNFHTSFASCQPAEQDALLLLASNPLLDAASTNGLPGLPAPLPNPVPPPAAAALCGISVRHTIQGSYCLPEDAGGLSDKGLGGQVTWASIGFDGDTQPLGNSVYDESLTENSPVEPGNRWTNDGFGGGGSGYTPSGAYREHRAVSYPEPDAASTLASLDELGDLVAALRRAGAVVTVPGGAG